jgi:hypothetical protein
MVESTLGFHPDRRGKTADIELGLLNEKLGFVNFFRLSDLAAGGSHTEGVLLGGQRRCSHDSTRRGQGVRRLPRE